MGSHFPLSHPLMVAERSQEKQALKPTYGKEEELPNYLVGEKTSWFHPSPGPCSQVLRLCMDLGGQRDSPRSVPAPGQMPGKQWLSSSPGSPASERDC